jgi:hypothetical protein
MVSNGINEERDKVKKADESGHRAALTSAQVAAEASAAHNQALIQGLNAFIQLDPKAHRWEVGVSGIRDHLLLTVIRTKTKMRMSSTLVTV